MSSALTEPGTATETRSGTRCRSVGMRHDNVNTEGLEAPRRFYEDIAGLTLKVFWIGPVSQGQSTEQTGHAFIVPASYPR